jgi:SAM-dependent methyltransferase
VSDIPNEFTKDYYDDKYFSDKTGKKFLSADGNIQHWGYLNPTGEFLGAKEIAKAWKTMFDPNNLLDVGCGRGTFLTYARDFGVEAEGFDYSEWAISNPYPRCKSEWLKVHDATKPWPYPDNSFDLIVCLDLMEHIYREDIDFVIDEMYRVARKWVFLQIAAVGGGSGFTIHEEGYILHKGESIPLNLQGCAVAGHVTVCSSEWWYEKLEREGWLSRRDMVQWFCSLVDPAIISNWLKNAIIVMEKIE